MIKIFPFLTGCCLVLLSSGALGWFSSELILVDQNPHADIAKVAKDVCETSKDSKKQISRISTVAKLDDYFHALPVDDKLVDCNERYHDSLHSLRELLELSPSNVCSPQKIAAIESFHHRFVSTAKEDVAARGDSHEAPQLLRLFFMHYALEVSAVCKRTLINNLEVEVERRFDEDDYRLISDSSMKEFKKMFLQEDRVYNFEDVLLTSDLLNSPLGGDLIDELVDPSTGDRAKLFIKAKDTSAVNELKRKCSRKFRPYYEKLILPIIRLANLGYSNTGDQFKRELEELRNNELAKKWYTITQICETVRPILYLSDASLANQVSVAISKEEAQAELAKLAPAAAGESPLQYEPLTNSLEGLDQLDSISSSDAQKLVKKVNSKTTAQERTIGRFMVKLARQIKTLPRKIFFSRKCQADNNAESCPRSGYVKQDLIKTYEKSFESMTEEELLNLEGSTRKNIQRNKRRERPNDATLLEVVNNYDQVMYTKSWGQIFSEWKQAILPSKLSFFLFILIVLGIATMSIVMAVLLG